mmetsp:Transcript_55021/g.170871  ORF Transcript_55021/g.170871 Transcript_55021/m.170871 type:complete len:355 (-) Transcript_55021:7-1071(-)
MCAAVVAKCLCRACRPVWLEPSACGLGGSSCTMAQSVDKAVPGWLATPNSAKRSKRSGVALLCAARPPKVRSWPRKPATTPPVPCSQKAPSRSLTSTSGSVPTTEPGSDAPMWKAPEKYGSGVRGCGAAPCSMPLKPKLCHPLTRKEECSAARLLSRRPPSSQLWTALQMGDRADAPSATASVGAAHACRAHSSIGARHTCSSLMSGGAAESRSKASCMRRPSLFRASVRRQLKAHGLAGARPCTCSWPAITKPGVDPTFGTSTGCCVLSAPAKLRPAVQRLPLPEPWTPCSCGAEMRRRSCSASSIQEASSRRTSCPLRLKDLPDFAMAAKSAGCWPLGKEAEGQASAFSPKA